MSDIKDCSSIEFGLDEYIYPKVMHYGFDYRFKESISSLLGKEIRNIKIPNHNLDIQRSNKNMVFIGLKFIEKCEGFNQCYLLFKSIDDKTIITLENMKSEFDEIRPDILCSKELKVDEVMYFETLYGCFSRDYNNRRLNEYGQYDILIK